MTGLILPPGAQPPKQPHIFPAKTKERAKFWCDYQWPGDVARAIVVAQREGKPLPVKMPENCPNRDCKICHPSAEDQDRIARGTK